MMQGVKCIICGDGYYGCRLAARRTAQVVDEPTPLILKFNPMTVADKIPELTWARYDKFRLVINE